MISVEHLTKIYGGQRVLDDLSFELARSETVVLVGASGCGKSTLLRCINQLEIPEQGRVTVGDVTIDCSRSVDREHRRQLRLRVGMVFQQFHLFPHRTALGNVIEAPVHVLGRKPADVELEARELLARVDLSDRLHHMPSQLSGGQQQRVAIARALAMRPEVLLLDEPTSALDPAMREEVGDVLRRLAGEGTTMLMVTHDLRLARDVADRVLFMDQGRIVESGPAEEVLDRPRDRRTRKFLGMV